MWNEIKPLIVIFVWTLLISLFWKGCDGWIAHVVGHPPIADATLVETMLLLLFARFMPRIILNAI